MSMHCAHRPHSGFIQTPWVWGKIASIGGAGDRVWRLCPSGVQGQSPWSEERSPPPQKLEAFCCVSIAEFCMYWKLLWKYIFTVPYVCNDDRNCMNCTYIINHKKMEVHLCHNIGKFLSILRIFALFKQEEIFKHV